MNRSTLAAATLALAAGAVSYRFLKPSKKDATPPKPAVALPTGAWTKAPVRAEDMKGPVVVTELWIHPIKSCRGTSVQEVRLTPSGLEYDRIWGIIDAKTHKVLTARDLPKMVLIHPELIFDPRSPEGGVLRVSFPAEAELEAFEVPLAPSSETLETWERLDDLSMWTSRNMEAYICEAISPAAHAASMTLSAFMGRQVHLVLKGARPRPCDPTHAYPELGTAAHPAESAFQDGYPVLLASQESLDDARANIRAAAGQNGVGEEWVTRDFDMRRFRSNIMVQGADVPYAEDAWKQVAFTSDEHGDASGPAKLTLVSKCTRCRLPNTDPDTAQLDGAVPSKVLMGYRTGIALEKGLFGKACWGVNGVPEGSGVIRVGDRVRVTARFDEDAR